MKTLSADVKKCAIIMYNDSTVGEVGFKLKWEEEELPRVDQHQYTGVVFSEGLKVGCVHRKQGTERGKGSGRNVASDTSRPGNLHTRIKTKYKK